MRSFLNSSTGFAVAFMVVVFIDIVLSNSEGTVLYSLLSKLALLALLLRYFVPQSSGLHPVERACAIMGMVCFSLGAMLIMVNNDLNVIVAGFLLLMTAKLCYSCAFVYTIRIDIDRLLPYLVFVTLYSLVVIYFLYDLPEHVPAYLFLVTALIMLKLAYLRYERVDRGSFTNAFSGAAMLLVAETILVFDRSFGASSLSGMLIVLLFWMSQYLMAGGLLIEGKTAPAALR